MKRTISIILILIVMLVGCTSSNDSKLESHVWSMTTVQSIDADGQAIAYGSSGSITLDTAIGVDLICSMANGEITLTDKTNSHTYNGTYSLKSSDAKSEIYEVKIGDTTGMAVYSVTTYSDDTEIDTLIISLGDYALNFFPAE